MLGEKAYQIFSQYIENRNIELPVDIQEELMNRFSSLV